MVKAYGFSNLIDQKDTPHHTLSGFFGGATSAPGAYELMLRSSIDLHKIRKSYLIALENAASIAGMFLTTEAVVIEEASDEPPMNPAAMGGGMPGMM